jgi:glucose-1-phosphate cytidylyltransferase
LRRVRGHLANEEVFLANYADGLTDLDLAGYTRAFVESGKIACFLSVRAPHTFHLVQADADNHVLKLEHVADSNVRINGGFFALRKEIFDYMNPGEELVVEPFARLIEKRQLLAVPYDGFWRNMDTFKDKLQLDDMTARGPGPWQLWER